MTDFTTQIASFLARKKLTPNSQKSYSYDLAQFCQHIGHKLDRHSLRLYQESLTGLKPSAQKRKISSVNQFLYFLYEEGVLDHFHKLKSPDVVVAQSDRTSRMDLSRFYEESPLKSGQLIALLILELGLTPSEMATLSISQIDKDFRVISLKKAGAVRVLTISDQLLPYLNWQDSQDLLFEKTGKPYTRQWFFVQLSNYLRSVGLPDLNAQKLREQHILKEADNGTTIFELARKLGLKNTVTLEKYYKHGH